MTLLDATSAQRLAQMFRLLGEPNRLSLVYACIDEELSVQQLAEKVGISISLASHHLRLLRTADLLQSQRRGKQVFYYAQEIKSSRVLLDIIQAELTQD